MKKLLVVALLVTMTMTACGKSEKKSEVVDTVISKEESSTEYSTAGETIASIVQDVTEIVEQTLEQENKDVVSTDVEDYGYKFISTESFLEDIKTGYIDVDTVASDETLTDEFVMSIGLGYIVLDDILIDEYSWYDFATMLCEEDKLLPEYLDDFKNSNTEVYGNSDPVEEQIVDRYYDYTDSRSGILRYEGSNFNYNMPEGWRVKTGNNVIYMISPNGTEFDINIVSESTWKEIKRDSSKQDEIAGIVDETFDGFNAIGFNFSREGVSISSPCELFDGIHNSRLYWVPLLGADGLPANIYYLDDDQYYQKRGNVRWDYIYVVARRHLPDCPYFDGRFSSQMDMTASLGNDMNNPESVELREDVLEALDILDSDAAIFFNSFTGDL